AVAKACRDLIEERSVKIGLRIARAVERSHRALRSSAATGMRRAAIENEDRRTISFAVLGEDLLPLQLGAAEHLAHEAAHIVLGSASAPRRGRRLHLRLAGTGQDLGAADEQARIDAERPADEAERHDRADAQLAPAAGAEPPRPAES